VNSNILTYTITGLTATKQYRLRVRAKSANLVAGDYSPISQYYAASVPDQIVIDTANTELNGSILTLKWTKPTINTSTQLEILGYRVYTNEGYRTYDFVLYKDIDNYDLNEQIFTDLLAGLEYGFKVSAYNAVGEGDRSSAYYAYAISKPGTPEAPTRVTSTEDSGTEASITLSWEPVMNTGNAPLTGYKLYQRDTITDTTTLAYDGTGAATTLSTTISNLVLDRDYEFWITALNPLESDTSEIVTLRAAALPDAPGALTKVDSSATTIELSWVAVTNTGGSPILAYTLVEEVYNESTGEILDQVRYFGATTQALIDGLVPGNTYIFKVKCTNMVGDSEYSDGYSFKITEAPSAPVNLNVTSYSTSQVVLTWRAPLKSGGATISAYNVYRQTLSDSTSSMTLLTTTSSSTFTYTDATVTSGLKYAYAVTATNSFSEGDQSSTVVVRTISAPSGMTKPIFVAHTATSITVSWSAPTSTGSAEVEYYILMMKAEYENTYTEVYKGLSKFHTVSNLPSGFTYLFMVKSANDAGESSLSSASDPIYAVEEPGIPQNLRIISRSSSQIKISWDAPATTGGLPLTGYLVYTAEGSAEYAEDASAPSKSNAKIRTYEITSATAGTLYSFKIAAKNSIYTSLVSRPMKIIAADLPEKPVNPPVISSYSTTSVTISLTTIPTANNGGSEITGYVVMIDNGLGDDDSYQIKSDSLQTSITINGLVAGRTYRVKYAGRNKVYDQNNMYAGDELQFSDTSQFTTAVAPSKPQNLRQSTLCYRTSIVIEWDSPSSTGGSPITEYVVTYFDGTTTTTTTLGDVNSHSITGLTPGTLYYINIKAITIFGDSGFLSAPLEAYPGVAPTSPSSVTFDSVTRNSITVSWAGLVDEDTGGTSANPIAISSYNLYMRKSTETEYKLIAQTTSTTYTATYLKSGILYKFKLSATNVMGESTLSSSNEMMAGTSPSSPGRPSVTVLYPTEVYIAWSEPFDSGGAPITSYTVSITKTSDSSVQTFTVVDARTFTFNSDTSIIAGTQYSVKVTANNFVTNYFAAKTGASSASRSFSTSVEPTAVPTLSSASVTRSSATVSWALLSTNDEKGYSTTDPVYILEADDGFGGEFYVINSSTTDTSKALTGVTPGTVLRLRMRVQNVIGYSSYSDILTIQFAEVPTAPDSPVFVDRNGNTTDGLSPYITISWSAPSDSGGSGILGYKVEYQENLGSWVEAYDGSSSPDVLEWKFEELTAGSAYNFRVYARNIVGYSVASSTTQIYCGTVPYSMSTSPRLTAVTLNTNSADIQVEWDAIDSSLNGGSAVLGYYLQTNSGYDTDFTEPGQQILASGSLTYTFTGLTKGATYKFRVAAYNEIYTTNPLGSTLNFSPELSTIAAIAPEKIASLTQNINKLAEGTISMEWTAPSNNGSPLTSYILYKDNGLVVFYQIYKGLNLYYTDSNLA